MKRIIRILFLISVTIINTQANNRSFEFRDAGNISFSSLEREISPGLGYADIDVIGIRNSYNPIAYLASLTSDYNAYVIKMRVNKSKPVSCELVEIKDEEKLMIKQCEGSRDEITHVGFVYYKDLKY